MLRRERRGGGGPIRPETRPNRKSLTADARQPRTPPIESRELAAAAAWLAEQKKGADIRVYEVSDQLQVADFFVLITGLNRPHVKAIHQELHVRLKAVGETYRRAEGADACWWVLLDYHDVVVHILQREAREYYDLDRLFQECPELDWAAVELPELPGASPEATGQPLLPRDGGA